MPAVGLIIAAVAIFSGGLFGYLRYLAYLRTMRWIIEQFGPDGIDWADPLAPKECQTDPQVSLIRSIGGAASKIRRRM
jgi:hypothetical protein